MSEVEPEGAPEVKVEHVSCWFGTVQALRDVNMTAPPGAVTALIGPTGAGKSTLLRLFNRIAEEEDDFRLEGRVSLGGRDVYDEDVSLPALRKRVGMVFRKPALFPGSVLDNLCFGPRMAGVNRADAAGAAEQALRRTGLWERFSPHLDAEPRGLVRADQQLLCLARALVLKPDVLALDTPTRTLDRASTSLLEEALRTLAGSCTVLLATDDVQQAGRLAQHTAFVSGGVVVEEGPTDLLFTRPSRQATEAWLSRRYA